MHISEAREFVGRRCCITWIDRLGQEITTRIRVNELMFVPLYGAYLVGDSEEVSLDKVTQIQPVE